VPKNNPLTETKEEEKPPSQVQDLAKKGSFFMPQSGHLPFYPYYFQNILTPKQQSYYHTNGHSPLLKSLQVGVVSQIDECRQLWKKFSPHKTLFDTWDFRLTFWKGYQHSPYFMILKNNLEDYALLPLWYEEDKKKYFWFGSWWQEENGFFVKDPIFVPLLLAACPSPVHLNAISLETVLWAKEFIELEPDDPKYILDLTKINSVDDFLARLKKKRRYNLRRDKRIIEAQNPQIIFDNFSDFDTLVKLSIKRFEEKGEDTDWEDPCRVETFRQVIRLGKTSKSYKVRMITVRIGNKVAGVDLIALFNGCYSPLKCGYDVKNFPGIGNYVNLLEIEDAVNLGMKKMDFLEIGYGWKEKWFEEVPLFKYDKK